MLLRLLLIGWPFATVYLDLGERLVSLWKLFCRSLIPFGSASNIALVSAQKCNKPTMVSAPSPMCECHWFFSLRMRLVDSDRQFVILVFSVFKYCWISWSTERKLVFVQIGEFTQNCFLNHLKLFLFPCPKWLFLNP